MVRVYHVCHAKAKDDNIERLRLANFKLISLYFFNFNTTQLELQWLHDDGFLRVFSWKFCSRYYGRNTTI